MGLHYHYLRNLLRYKVLFSVWIKSVEWKRKITKTQNWNTVLPSKQNPPKHCLIQNKKPTISLQARQLGPIRLQPKHKMRDSLSIKNINAEKFQSTFQSLESCLRSLQEKVLNDIAPSPPSQKASSNFGPCKMLVNTWKKNNMRYSIEYVLFSVKKSSAA